MRIEIGKFINFISGNYNEKNLYWEVRLIKTKNRRFFQDIEEMKDFIFENRNTDVLVSLNPRVGEGGTEEFVKFGNMFFIDVDYRDSSGNRIPIDKQEAMKIRNILMENFLRPSIIVSSGYGLHIYYKLSKPVEKELWISLERQLLNKIKDLVNACIDPVAISQCVRVPGTINTKYGKEVSYVDESYLVYDLKDFENFFELKPVSEVLHVKVNVKPKKLSVEKVKDIVRVFDGFWVKGHRQMLTLWLCGLMVKLGYPFEDCYSIVNSICETYGDEERRMRLYTVEREYKIDNPRRRGVSGIIEEMFDIANEMGYSYEKVLRRLYRLFKLVGIKKSDYLPKIVERLILEGHYEKGFRRFIDRLSEEALLKMAEFEKGNEKIIAMIDRRIRSPKNRAKFLKIKASS
mgnify:CR=1 FL=1